MKPKARKVPKGDLLQPKYLQTVPVDQNTVVNLVFHLRHNFEQHTAFSRTVPLHRLATPDSMTRLNLNSTLTCHISDARGGMPLVELLPGNHELHFYYQQVGASTQEYIRRTHSDPLIRRTQSDPLIRRTQSDPLASWHTNPEPDFRFYLHELGPLDAPCGLNHTDFLVHKIEVSMRSPLRDFYYAARRAELMNVCGNMVFDIHGVSGFIAQKIERVMKSKKLHSTHFELYQMTTPDTSLPMKVKCSAMKDPLEMKKTLYEMLPRGQQTELEAAEPRPYENAAFLPMTTYLAIVSTKIGKRVASPGVDGNRMFLKYLKRIGCRENDVTIGPRYRNTRKDNWVCSDYKTDLDDTKYVGLSFKINNWSSILGIVHAGKLLPRNSALPGKCCAEAVVYWSGAVTITFKFKNHFGATWTKHLQERLFLLSNMFTAILYDFF
jgi:hypothetical protein